MNTIHQNRIATRSKLLGGVAIVALSSALATGAYAQAIESVVVTGTNIRGQAPVGSNVIALGRADIEATGAITM